MLDAKHVTPKYGQAGAMAREESGHAPPRRCGGKGEGVHQTSKHNVQGKHVRWELLRAIVGERSN